ncbi:MAG TPA: TAXI family TRAP transporter solute-binding subunit [Burkholderiales bacterium]|nr:TAXI family TRAP transporter solute-binding subunit [Burkholderiales bacterium]
MKRVLAAAVALSALVSFPVAAQKYNLTLTGASPGGLWSALGTGLDAALAKAYPGSTVTYQTSSGGLANVPLVAQGKAPIGIASDGELKVAVDGKEPFKAPVAGVRVLARVYAPESRFQMTHVIVSKAFVDQHKVKSFKDIVERKLPLRVAINRRGNLDGDVSEVLMAEMGATEKAIESWGGQLVRAASKEMSSLYQDRRLDMMNYGIAFNHPSIQEAVKAVDSVLLDIPDDVVRKVADRFGGAPCEVKEGEYKWSPGAATNVCVGALFVVSEKMDDALAYNLARAMVEQIEEFKDRSHRAIKATLTPKVIASRAAAPFHPGAAKFYREKGLQ